jgi:S-methylmethionine-dependent homocysteine/selenocysteine methylase
MINCAHPIHFESILAGNPDWTSRLGGMRANSSRLSHAELNEAAELDRGDPADLGRRYGALRAQLPQLRVLGGCCGTDHQHVAEIAAACV